MVSPKPTSKVAADSNTPAAPHKVKIVKGSKPLVHHKFYLDIEKHQVAARIEQRIKELGGSIEFFLTKDITHFITDRLSQSSVSTAANNSTRETTPSPVTTPRTPASVPSVSSPYNGPNDSKAKSHSSRADAMLQRVRQQQQQQHQSSQQQQQQQPVNESVTTTISPQVEQQQQQPSSQATSPIQVAKSWGRPVWSAEYAFKFLDKVTAALKFYAPSSSQSSSSSAAVRSAKVKVLKGDYIKIETFDKRFRPFYQELKRWPELNLKARPTHSPFESASAIFDAHEVSKRSKKFSKIDSRTTTTTTTTTPAHLGMTRKNRPATAAKQRLNNSKSTTDRQCGYCEICHMEYDVLKVHLKTEQHVNFARNDANFASLDKLIDSGASVDAFLRVQQVGAAAAGAAAGGEVNGRVNGNVFGKRMATKRGSAVVETQQMNGNCSEEYLPPIAAKRARTKRNCSIEEDTLNQMTATTPALANRIRGLRWRPTSPEAKSPPQQPQSPTSSSNQTFQQQQQQQPLNKVLKRTSSREAKSPQSPTNLLDQSKKAIVKLRRVRQSELNRLNNEAENFMFPKTPNYSSATDDTTDEDTEPRVKTTPPANARTKKAAAPTNAKMSISTSSPQSVPSPPPPPLPSSTTTPIRNRRPVQRRRNEVAALLEDAAKERPTPSSSSRQRFQAAPIQSSPSPSTITRLARAPAARSPIATEDRVGELRASMMSPPGTPTQSSKWVNFRRKYQEIEGRTCFSFERDPLREPWLETFERQDVGNERVYEYFGSTAYRKLPFEMGLMPPLKANCCPLSSSCARSSAAEVKLKVITARNRTRSSSGVLAAAAAATAATPQPSTSGVLSAEERKLLPLKKRKLLLDADTPRKSPREHASTLAILSSLGFRRNRNSSQVSLMDVDEDENSNSTMTSNQTSKSTEAAATEEEKSSAATPAPTEPSVIENPIRLLREMEEMFYQSLDESEGLFNVALGQPPNDDQDPIIGPSLPPDLTQLLDTCSEEPLTLKEVNQKERAVIRKLHFIVKPKLVTSGFRFNKKRRNNRTGWPNRRKPGTLAATTAAALKDENLLKGATTEEETELSKTVLTPDIFAVSSDSLDSNVTEFLRRKAKECPDTPSSKSVPVSDNERGLFSSSACETEEETTTGDEKPSRNTARTAPRYTFERYPKAMASSMRTRSSDLQKRKSVTPKKYTQDAAADTTTRSPASTSPQKFSPRKLRRPRGRWYRER